MSEPARIDQCASCGGPVPFGASVCEVYTTAARFAEKIPAPPATTREEDR